MTDQAKQDLKEYNELKNNEQKPDWHNTVVTRHPVVKEHASS
jgi:hypothetical protein